MPLNPGDILGRYVIDGLLGRGGNGTVYRAHDTRLQRPVALKVLADDGATGAGVARILREARIAAKLAQHPNIVAIYDADDVKTGPHAGLAYLAMELVEGKPLRAYVGDPSVPIATRVRWLTDAARGLAAAHERGLVHRDVKPENIMVRHDGVAKVLDFGVAKELSGAELAAMRPRSPSAGLPTLELEGGVDAHAATATGKGTVFGAPYYMSPEQMKGEALDARTDQFSWGVVAYELLAGVPPWGTDYAAGKVVAAVLGMEPAAQPLRDAHVPDWMLDVLRRTLAKATRDRFTAMSEVVAALEAGGVSSPTRDSGPQTHRDGWGASGLTKALWLGAAALVAVGSTLGGIHVVRSRSHAVAGLASLPSARKAAGIACTSNAECSRSVGTPSVCLEGSCVALASADCHVLANDYTLKNDSTVWIGSLYPLSGPLAAYGPINERATDLGRQDFEEATTVLNATGQSVRPVGLVSCDSGTNIDRAARHLVEDLHVAAIVGFPDANDLLRLASTEFARRRVLAVTTLSSSVLVTQLPRTDGDPPLVWRTSFNMADCARAVAAFAEEVVEKQLRAEGTSVTRITLLRKKTPTLLAASERLFDALHFNGRPTLANGDLFQELVLDPGAADPAIEVQEKLARLREFNPNIVLYTGESFVKTIIQPFEQGLKRSSRGRPRYITMSSLQGPILELMGDNVDLRRRNFGITLPSTTQANGKLTLHYNGVYGTNLSRVDMPSTAYDGFYLVAYAAMALGSEPITGPSLARAIGRLLPPGPSVEVGPGSIFAAFSAFRGGASIDIVGAGSPLQLDPQTGDNRSDLGISCAEIDAKGRAIGAAESGLVYSSQTGTLTGTLMCP